MLCLSCALDPGDWKGKEKEGPWKEMGFLGRKGTLRRNGGPGKERPWEQPILRAPTYAH